MSFHAVAWALEQDLPTREKFTLICLANYADASGKCWPSQALIARQSGQSLRTVRACMERLEAQGYITRRGRVRGDGGRTSDMVRLVRPGAPVLPDDDAVEVDTFESTPPRHTVPTPPAGGAGAPPAGGAGGPGTACPAEPVIEPSSEEPPTEPRSAADAAAQRAEPEPGAQTIVGAWIDACGDARPPRRVIGHLSKQVRELLDEGQPYADVLAAVQVWHSKGLNPASLPSVLHEVRQHGTPPLPGMGSRGNANDRRAQDTAALLNRTPWEGAMLTADDWRAERERTAHGHPNHPTLDTQGALEA